MTNKIKRGGGGGEKVTTKKLISMKQHGTLSMSESKLLRKNYESGKAVFECVENLTDITGLQVNKSNKLMQTQAAATKYR